MPKLFLTLCPGCKQELKYVEIMGKAYLGCKYCEKFWITDKRWKYEKDLIRVSYFHKTWQDVEHHADVDSQDKDVDQLQGVDESQDGQELEAHWGV